MFRAYKYRLSPNEAQQELINKHIGSVRMVYNLALATKTNAYTSHKINLSRYNLQKQLKDLKEECIWLKEINSQSLQYSLLNLDIAYRSFFKGNGFPNFKSKHKGSQSFSIPQNVKVKDNRLIIPKFGKQGIKIIIHRELKGTIKQATISRTPTGKYFVSILADTNIEFPKKVKIKESTTIGLDLGIKDFAITSDGEVFSNPKHLRTSMSRLKVLQRRASKKQKGSANRKKANLKVALLHETITNQRKDFQHKLSSKLISENQTIALETLKISNMVKNHRLAQAINDVSWYSFTEMLEYKANWYGKNIIRVGTFFPSSKMCSSCGYINKELKLSDRSWVCPVCSKEHDRDLNASLNIKQFALKHSGQELSVEPVELPTLVGTVKQEASLSPLGVGR
jgi:putative transposase